MKKSNLALISKKLCSAALASGLLVSGCSLKQPNHATIRVSFPPAPASALARSLKAPSSARGLIGVASPATLDDFTCFGVNVTSDDIPTSTATQSCSTSGMPAPGLIGGLAPINGGTIELQVPYGSNRTFQLFAVQSRAGCDAATDALVSKFGSTQLAVPMEVGRVVSDVLGSTSLNIHAAWDPATPKPMFCPSGAEVPSGLSIIGPTSVKTTDCSAITLTLKDNAGATATTDVALSVSVSSQTSGAFFADAACSQPLASKASTSITQAVAAQTGSGASATVAIAAGTSSSAFYFNAISAGSTTLSASSLGLNSASLSIAAQAPALGATALRFSGSPNPTASAGVPFSVPSVQAVDANLIPVPTASGSVSLSAYTDDTCTNPATGSFTAGPAALVSGSATFSSATYTKAETIYLKASSGALAAACSGAISVDAGIPSASLSTLTASPTGGLNADGISSSAITVVLKDAYGNPSPGRTINLLASGGGSINPSTANSDTTGTAIFTLTSTSPGSVTVSFSNPSGFSSLNTAVTFIASTVSPTYSTITGTSGITANGSAASTITIQLRDASNNPVSGIVPTFGATDTGTTNTYGACSSSNSSGTSTCQLRSTHAETKSLSLTTPVVVAGSAIQFVPGPTATFNISGITGPLVSGTPSSLTLTAFDANGNLATNYLGSVSFSSSDPFATLPAAFAFSPGDAGIKAVSGLTLMTVGNQSITAFESGNPGVSGTQSNIQVLAGPPSSNYSSLTAIPSTAPADGSTIALSVIVKDAYNNPLQGIVPQASITGSQNAFSGFSPSDANGLSTATLSSSLSEIKAVSITSPSQLSNLNTSVTFTPAGVNGELVFSTQPSTSAMGDMPLSISPVVQVQDLFGNPFAGPVATVALGAYLDPTCQVSAGVQGKSIFNVNAIQNPIVAAANTAAFSNVTISMPGTIYLKASAHGFLSACSNAINVVPSGPMHLTISGAKSAMIATCSTPLNVRLVDSAYQPVSANSPVNVTLGGQGAGAFYLDPSCTSAVSNISIPVGANSQSFYFKSYSPQATQLGAYAGGLTSGTRDFSVTNTANAAGIVEIQGPISIPVSQCSQAYSITRRSYTTNTPDLSLSDTYSLSGDSPGIQFFASNDPACTAPISNVTIPPGAPSTSFYIRDSVPGLHTYAATDLSGYSVMDFGGFYGVNEFNPITDIAFISDEYLAVSAGRCYGVAITLLDANGRPANAPGTFYLPINISGPIQTFSDHDCTSPQSQVQIQGGTSTGLIFVEGLSPSNSSITVNASSLGLPSNPQLAINVGPAVPSRFNLSGNTTQPTGTCAQMTLTVTNDAGSPVTLTNSLMASISVNGGSAMIYDSPSCATVNSSLYFAPGTSNATFFIKDYNNETANLIVTAPGLDGNWLTLSFGNGGGGGGMPQFVFNGPIAGSAGQCIGPFYVQSQMNGSPYPAPMAMSVSLGWTSGGAQLYSDACVTSLPGNYLNFAPATTTSTPFYLVSPAPEVLGLYAHEASNTYSDGNLGLVIAGAGSPNQILLMGPNNTGTYNCVPFTVVLSNGPSYPVTAPVTESINLNVSPLGSLYTDQGCGSPIAGGMVYIPTGQAASTVYFRSTTQGSTYIYASGSGLGSTNVPISINSGGGGGGTPTQLKFNGPVSSNLSGCNTYSVELHDATNALTSNTTGIPVYVNLSSGSAQFYPAGDMACAASIGQVNIPVGASAASFNVRFNTMGSVYLYADASGFASANIPVNVTSGGGGSSHFVINGPTSGAVNQCLGPYNVQLYDGTSPFPAGSPLSISLGWNTGSAQVFSDACISSLPGNQVNIPPAQSMSQNFYIRLPVAEVLSLYAHETSNAFGDGNATLVSAISGTPWQASLMGPSNIGMNSCTAYQVVLQDSGYTPVFAQGGGQSVYLSSSPSGYFYSDPGCGAMLSGGYAQIPVGIASITVYYQTYTTGPINLSVNGPGLPNVYLNIYSGGGGGAAPTISNIAPTSGWNQASPLVTVYGNNFSPGSVIEINGTACPNFSYMSPSQVSCHPAQTSYVGYADVRVRNPDNQFATLYSSYNFLPSGYWTRGPDAFAPRRNALGVWSGSEVILMGGDNCGPQYSDGIAYNPMSNSWRTLPPAPGAFGQRALGSLVWVAGKAIYWGGQLASNSNPIIYDPSNNSWTVGSAAGAPSVRYNHRAVAAGNKMIVWGGYNGSFLSDGGVYDVLSDTWSPVPTPGLSAGGGEGPAVGWTGSKLFTFGGKISVGGTLVNDSGLFDLGTWTTPTFGNRPAPNAGMQTAWTGSKMLVYGGYWSFSGYTYDPYADIWGTMAPPPFPLADVRADWTGSKLMIWGGSGASGGAVYDPAMDSWNTFNAAGEPAGRESHTVVWTGNQLVVFGGDIGGACQSDLYTYGNGP